MAKLTFLGATGTVTGSRYSLELANEKMLIDCGLFQGLKENRMKNWDPFPVNPSDFNRVVLTHAHIDHTGYLPRFCKDGFRGRVNSTNATFDFCKILLLDSAHLQEEDAYFANKQGFSKHDPALPLYTIRDAEWALAFFSPFNYGENIELDGGIRLKFRDAGHILGSSFVDIKTTDGTKQRKILFSGDLGRPGLPILHEPVQPYNVDYLVLESTYGNRLHDAISPHDELARVINESIKRGGVLIIPSFAVGRTQTILYEIRELEEMGKIPSIPVYVDSPMAIEAMEIFEDKISDLNLKSRIETIEGKRIIRPKNLTLVKTRNESKELNKIKERAIIISSSGMATGGRILHHLANRIYEPSNTILFIGYQAEGTRGKTILDGASTVRLHGQDFDVKAKIESITGYSGHADYNEILAWLMGFNRAPERIFITHGEPEASQALAEKIRSRFGWKVEVPAFGESVELDM